MLDSELIGAGFAALQATAVQGSINTAVAAAGSSITDATVLTSAVNYVNSGTGGVKLPTWAGTGDLFSVYNGTGSTITVYPISASGIINGGSTGAGVSVTAHRGGKFRVLDNGVNIGAVYS